MYQQIDTAHREIAALTADCRPEDGLYRFAGDTEGRLGAVETALAGALAQARDAGDMAAFSRICQAQRAAGRVRGAAGAEERFWRIGEIVTRLA